MKKLLLKKEIIFLIILSSLIIWPIIIPGYFSHHDDLQVIRIHQMRSCIMDLQVPCRWVPDMGYGYGFPLFNYYGVFPYYLGAIFSFFLGFLGAAKMIFLIPLILSGISMYLLSRQLFGNYAGLVSAVLYMYAPYRALDAYARGAVSENLALSLIPLVFYFGLKLVYSGSKKDFIGLVISLSLFLITHNIMSLFFSPVLLMFLGVYLFKKKFANTKQLLLSIVLSFGIAAFFLLPAYFEKNLVQTEKLTVNALDFRNHYISVFQLFFDRSWGYGASVFGPDDGLSFQVGWPHWWLVLMASMFIFIYILLKFKVIMRKSRLLSSKKLSKNVFLTALLVILFVVSVFMTHNKSTFIWEKIRILRYSQFPWRFLSLSTFSSSLIAGYVVSSIKKKLRVGIAAFILIITVLLNFNYFKPNEFVKVNEKEKLSGSLWEEQQKGAVYDYLPKTASKPDDIAPTNPIVVSGRALVSNFSKSSNKWQFNVSTSEESEIEVPVFHFPGWIVKVNDSYYRHSHKNPLGVISVYLPIGEYFVSGNFTNTPVRTVSNIISVISFLFFIYLVGYGKNRKVFK
jgi:hypothetical protein